MAWTTPSTWSAGAILTAAQLNTQLRDNLSYLKGDAGTTVAISNSMSITGSITASAGLNVGTAAGASTGQIAVRGDSLYENILSVSNNTTGTAVALQSVNSGGHKYDLLSTGTAADAGAGCFAIFDATAAAYRLMITTSGRVGYGTTAPNGRLEVDDGVGGVVHWSTAISGSDVGGSSQAVTANGTVTYGIMALGVARASSGSTAATPLTGGGGAAIVLGASQTWAVGADTLTLGVNASGGVFIQRTAGSLTHKVTLWILYL